MFEIKNLTKKYGEEFALNSISLSIYKGLNFIVGASGSGKTTLLKILSGMESGYDGSVFYCGKDISTFSAKEKSALYNTTFGFIWQDFHLLEEATVLENILLPQYLQDSKNAVSAKYVLKQLKIEDLKDKKVKFLSGGQKQRVAIARELMKDPEVIFCDEPTSALDAKSAKNIMDILRILSTKKTVIVVTHDTSLITARDRIYELDKGELISASANIQKNKFPDILTSTPALSLKNAFRIAFTNIKNKPARFATSVISLLLAGTLILTTISGAIGSSGQSEFDKLVETYGEGILDIGLVGSFTSAGATEGMDEDKPNGDVDQNLDGLYEKYQNDERVEFIVSMQPYDNINVTVDGTVHPVEFTGNSPVLTKMVAGSIPNDDNFQVVVPSNFVKNIGLTPEDALGKEIDFSATVVQWVNNQPVDQPVQIKANICGVADNTVVYDYEGQPYSFSVDDSFFFNRSATEELRRQGGVNNKSANFTIRTKSPEALISLKDELNQNGIVPLGRFELVEDMVRLNQQTNEQTGTAGVIIAVLAVLLVITVFAMTSFLRRREYAIYKVSGYHNGHLTGISAVEAILTAAAAAVLLPLASPLLNMAAEGMFRTSILSTEKLLIGALLILGSAIISFASVIPGYVTTSVSSMLKEGAKS